jgi:hypothetical protein
MFKLVIDRSSLISPGNGKETLNVKFEELLLGTGIMIDSSIIELLSVEFKYNKSASGPTGSSSGSISFSSRILL